MVLFQRSPLKEYFLRRLANKINQDKLQTHHKTSSIFFFLQVHGQYSKDKVLDLLVPLFPLPLIFLLPLILIFFINFFYLPLLYPSLFFLLLILCFHFHPFSYSSKSQESSFHSIKLKGFFSFLISFFLVKLEQ